MTGNRIACVLLLLLVSFFWAGCDPCCDEPANSWYSRQTVFQARQEGFDYPCTVCLAAEGNVDALHILMRMKGFDLGGAAGHAVVLTCMVEKFGQCAFLRELRKQPEDVADYVTTLIRQEVARRENCPQQRLKSDYARFQDRYPCLYAYSMRRYGQYTAEGILGADGKSSTCR